MEGRGLLGIAERDAILNCNKWRAAVFERDDVTSNILFADSADDGYKAPAYFSWDIMTAIRISHLRGDSGSTHTQHMPQCGGCFLIRICERWSSNPELALRVFACYPGPDGGAPLLDVDFPLLVFDFDFFDTSDIFLEKFPLMSIRSLHCVLICTPRYL